MPRQTTLADYQARLLRAQRLVEEHIDDPLDPADLARAASFSLHHFHRIFRAQMGESVMQHVRRLRLERAARRLRTSDARVLEVALEAGYESHEAFTRAFLERFGVPPSQFRDTQPERLLRWQAAGDAAPRGPIALQTFPALRVAFMRHRGGYAGVHQTWQKMIAWAEARGILRDRPVLYGVCPDDPDVTDEAHLRFDACAALDDGADAPREAGVGIMQIPGGTFAVGVHRGSYLTLHETYLDVIGRWFPKSGYEPAADAVVEHYRNDPRRVPEADLLTEVRVRVAD
jgi:AraC family transcriptional regulator